MRCLRISCRASWAPTSARSSRAGSGVRHRVRGHDLQVTDRDRCPDADLFAGGVRRALGELAQQLT
jgi:hypothetical protein